MSKTENNSLPIKVIEELTKTLNIAPSVYEDAEKKYKAVAKFLGESDDPILKDAHIYPQGSIRLGTAVKPINQEEFDIDLVIHLPSVTQQADSDLVHRSIGNRLLDEQSIYKDKTTKLNRGWRINYSGNFHLDITPAIENPFAFAEEFHYTDTAEFVPDKKLQGWKDSNPRGFATWFDEMDKLLPNLIKLSLESSNMIIAKDYKVDDIPEYNHYKGMLKRVVQVLKRHRDIYFNERQKDLVEFKPISILLTTLAAKSYRDIAKSQNSYSNPYDLMVDIITNMVQYIDLEYGKYIVVNPTNEKENFAEKWNKSELYGHAFLQWQKSALLEIKSLRELQGLDKLQLSLEESYGKNYAQKVIASLNDDVQKNRDIGLLAPSILISETDAVVKPNKFFGAH